MIIVDKKPDTWSWSGNPIPFHLYSTLAAADESTVIEVKIFTKKVTDGDFFERTMLPMNPFEGYVRFDIREVIDSILEYQTPEITLNPERIQTNHLQTTEYYISYREVSETHPAEAWVDDQPRYAIKGGLNREKWRGNNFFASYFPDKKPFLTWQLNGRMAGGNESMWLTFLHVSDRDSRNFKLRATAFFVNETYEVKDIDFPDAIQPPGTLFFLPAGAVQLGLATLSANRLYYWTIEVIDGGADNEALSEKFKYYQDNRYDPNEVCLYYRNSLGGMDSIRVRGLIETNTEYAYEEQERVLPDNYYESHVIMASRIIYSSKENLQWTGDAGFVTKEEQERLRDLHLIRELYIRLRNKWLPMLNVTGNFKLKASDAKMFSMPVSWKPAHGGNHFYTPNHIDIGDPAAELSCFSGVINMSVNVIIDAVNGNDATINFELSDEDSVGVVAFRYRVPGVLDAWTIQAAGNLPLVIQNLPINKQYQIQVQPLCPNGAFGNLSVKDFNTIPDIGQGDYYGQVENTLGDELLIKVEIKGSTMGPIFNQTVGANSFINFYPPLADNVELAITVQKLNGMLGYQPYRCTVRLYCNGRENDIPSQSLDGSQWIFPFVRTAPPVKIVIA